MASVFEITRNDPHNPLARHRWRFVVLAHHIGDSIRVVLDSYWYETKETSRHKWRAEDDHYYDRYNTNGRSGRGVMHLAKVPQPFNVAAEAREVTAKQIVVVTHPTANEGFGNDLNAGPVRTGRNGRDEQATVLP